MAEPQTRTRHRANANFSMKPYDWRRTTDIFARLNCSKDPKSLRPGGPATVFVFSFSPNSNMTTIFGYGSLLSAESTALSLKTARNRRIGILPDYARVFSLVSLNAVKANPAAIEEKTIAALAIRPSPGDVVIGVLFEVDDVEVPAYKLREARYALPTLDVYTSDGIRVPALVAVESSDDVYLSTVCGGDAAVYEKEVGQYYTGSLWHRKDILPNTPYVHVCVNGALSLGADVLVSLLATLLADGVSTLHSYLMRSPLTTLTTSPAGVPYNPKGPVLGPCVPSLSRPLLCVIGPPLAASPAVDAHTAVCTSSSSTPPHSLLYLDWSLEWVFGDRLSRVIDFVCDSPCVLGAVVLGADIQSAVYSLLSSRTCDGAPGTAACCVDGGCDCISTISRPCLALTTPPLHCTDVCRSPPTDCTSLLMSTGATSARAVGVLTKHKSGYVVSCPPPVLPDDAAWSDITTATFNRLLTCQATVDAMPAAPQLSTDTCSCAPTVPTGK